MNKIKVERECYMKHMETSLNDPNELVMFSNSILKSFFFDTFFGELEDELSPLVDLEKKDELLHLTQISKKNCTIVYSSTCIDLVSSSSNFSL